MAFAYGSTNVSFVQKRNGKNVTYIYIFIFNAVRDFPGHGYIHVQVRAEYLYHTYLTLNAVVESLYRARFSSAK